MFERLTPYYYAGGGEVLLSKRLSTGQPEGFLPLGKVSKAALQVKELFRTHRESRREGDIDKAQSTGIQVDITLDVEQAEAATVALFLKGEAQSILAGTEVEYHQVCPGFRYAVRRIGLTGITIKDQAGVITYVGGLNYESSLDVGGFSILADQSGALNAITCNDVLKVEYTHGSQKELGDLNAVQEEYWMRIEGLNTAQDNTPVTLDFYKVMPQLVMAFSLLSEKRESSNLTSTLLCDFLRCQEDRFFKIRSLK